MKLIDYLPPILKEIYEFKLLSDAEDKELATVKESIDKSIKEMFVYTAENEGLERLENMLGITAVSDDSIDFRRFRILTKLNGSNRDLIKKIKVIVGNDFDINYYWSEYRLSVKLPLKNKKYLDEVKDMLDNTAPLNLLIETVLKYNTYGLIKNKNLTYGDLKSRGCTYRQLREEEF